MIRLTHFSRYVSVAVLAAGGDWLAFSVLISLLGAPHLESLMIAPPSRRRGVVLQQPLLDLG